MILLNYGSIIYSPYSYISKLYNKYNTINCLVSFSGKPTWANTLIINSSALDVAIASHLVKYSRHVLRLESSDLLW